MCARACVCVCASWCELVCQGAREALTHTRARAHTRPHTPAYAPLRACSDGGRISNVATPIPPGASEVTFPLVVSERQMQQVGGDLVYDQMKVCMRA